ncbi:MAG: ATP-dependent DNA helicase RecG [Patescibacteria group bacterium]
MADVTLATELSTLFRFKDNQKQALKKLSLTTVDDLLRYIPFRYVPRGSLRAIGEIRAGEFATVEGKIGKLDYEKTWRKKMNIAKAELADDTGKLGLVWFHQPYVARILIDGELVRAHGKVSEKNGRLSISNPIFEKIDRLSFRNAKDASLIPVYPGVRGLSSRWFQFHLQKIFATLPKTAYEDQIPQAVRDKYHLPDLASTIRAIHFPKNEKEVEAAKKRLAFEEIFIIQLARMRERLELEEQSAIAVETDKRVLKAFLQQLPFTLTKTQTQILDSILSDISRPIPMARLLEGDVGSGKTIIAAASASLVAHAGYQITYMAPTEILARQHFETFIKFLGNSVGKIGLITSSEARVYPSKAFRGQSAHIPKSQVARWVESGEIKVLIGTHALLSEKIKFRNLAFIVVDEQHRFGVAQRRTLAKRSSKDHSQIPHFLSMTATPIPRTLALTIYGDLDLSVLDETPPGKAAIETQIFIKPKIRAWESIRKELEKGRQAFIVCPRINTDEDDETGRKKQKSVKDVFAEISKTIFPTFKSAMLHGKMTPREKDETMNKFRDHKIDILIATSLIEVGIDIPNATIMVVEGADRFGLAQLHQLRGRIGRGQHHSYFIAVTDSSSPKTADRLRALEHAANGFELAEQDLQLRGTGELTGKNQWGLSDIGMEALKNIKMVEAARTEARAILSEGRDLVLYPLLQEALARLGDSAFHFE